jgi:hypothetical protein
LSESSAQGELIRKSSAQLRRLLGPVALLLAMVPLTSSAYVIVCGPDGFDVYRCADGHEVSCGSSPNQFDCPAEEIIGNMACASYGGLVSVGPSQNRPWLLSDYQGKLDFHSMECTECSSTEPIPISYARWMGACGGATLVCDERERDCLSRQTGFKNYCIYLRAKMTSFWTIAFAPRKVAP